VAKEVKLSDEEITKYYETHKAELKSEEKRRVGLVAFALNEEQKKLKGKERVEVLQKLADGANDFTQALLEKGAQFEAVAAQFKVPVQVTGDFTKSQPDPLLKTSPPLVEAASQLKAEEPNSDPVQVGDGFSVLHLVGVEPAQPLPLEGAKPQIVETLRKQRVAEMVAAKGAEAAGKIRQALQAGTPLAVALQQTGLPMEKIPPFAPADPPAMSAEPGQTPPPVAPDLQVIKGAVTSMSAGEVSDFIPTEAGGVVAVLEKREPADPAKYEITKAMFTNSALRNQREIAFYEWLRERRRAAGVQTTREPVAEPSAG